MRGTTVTLAGPAGSGKTTAARRLGLKLGREVVSGGELFRQMARDRKLDLLAFSALAEKDPRLDHELDERMVGLANGQRILESRIIGELLHRRSLPVWRIGLTAPEEVRAERVGQRENRPASEVLPEMRQRETSERRRYLHYYAIDVDQLGTELTLDTEALGPDAVVEAILSALPPEILHP
ncbi:cytidylate kinase [mine drainage metagenome]|uniref:Cytidylate kinase n=1 Tax=mine drainage metagenome TaxID=410659 RepID=T1CUX0_9ZZZZ